LTHQGNDGFAEPAYYSGLVAISGTSTAFSSSLSRHRADPVPLDGLVHVRRLARQTIMLRSLAKDFAMAPASRASGRRARARLLAGPSKRLTGLPLGKRSLLPGRHCSRPKVGRIADVSPFIKHPTIRQCLLEMREPCVRDLSNLAKRQLFKELRDDNSAQAAWMTIELPTLSDLQPGTRRRAVYQETIG
jgi:hypothetical protein